MLHRYALHIATFQLMCTIDSHRKMSLNAVIPIDLVIVHQIIQKLFHIEVIHAFIKQIAKCMHTDTTIFFLFWSTQFEIGFIFLFLFSRLNLMLNSDKSVISAKIRSMYDFHRGEKKRIQKCQY